MKNTILKTILAAMAVLIISAFAHISASAQEEVKTDDTSADAESRHESSEWRRKLEGAWNVTVTLRNCETGAALASFSAMNTYMRGGTMTEVGIGVPPSQRYPSSGVWKYQGARNYTSAFQFFRFDASGNYTGIQKVRRQMRLASSGDAFTTTANVEIFNPAGTLVATGCATEAATRFE